MKMGKVKSSNIEAIGYSNKTKKLRIKFFTGKDIYEYKNVGKKIHQELMKSKSIGSFFFKNIKNNYEFIRVNPEREIKKENKKYSGKHTRQ